MDHPGSETQEPESSSMKMCAVHLRVQAVGSCYFCDGNFCIDCVTVVSGFGDDKTSDYVNTKVCGNCRGKFERIVREQAVTLKSIFLSILLGMVFSCLGAAVWAFEAARSGKEREVIAIGLGLLVGLGVKIGAGKARSYLFKGISCVIGVFAFLLAKYLTFVTFVNQQFETGQVSNFRIPYFSSASLDWFIEQYPVNSSSYDTIWIAAVLLLAFVVPPATRAKIKTPIDN
ncbi:MAG: hypothetical protein NUW37_04540 [Planctomycetes bacterium]|nr:hypothetical protein [Planctomycetota bacterium]